MSSEVAGWPYRWCAWAKRGITIARSEWASYASNGQIMNVFVCHNHWMNELSMRAMGRWQMSVWVCLPRVLNERASQVMGGWWLCELICLSEVSNVCHGRWLCKQSEWWVDDNCLCEWLCVSKVSSVCHNCWMSEQCKWWAVDDYLCELICMSEASSVCLGSWMKQCKQWADENCLCVLSVRVILHERSKQCLPWA